MSNGEVCCILGVCCPPARARRKLAKALVTDVGLSQAQADATADWIRDRFDLAPAGTLEAFKDAIANQARGHAPEDEAGDD